MKLVCNYAKTHHIWWIDVRWHLSGTSAQLCLPWCTVCILLWIMSGSFVATDWVELKSEKEIKSMNLLSSDWRMLAYLRLSQSSVKHHSWVYCDGVKISTMSLHNIFIIAISIAFVVPHQNYSPDLKELKTEYLLWTRALFYKEEVQLTR